MHQRSFTNFPFTTDSIMDAKLFRNEAGVAEEPRQRPAEPLTSVQIRPPALRLQAT